MAQNQPTTRASLIARAIADAESIEQPAERVQRLTLLRRSLQTADEQARAADAIEAQIDAVPEQAREHLRGQLAAIRADIAVRRVMEARRGGQPLPADHEAVQAAITAIEAAPSPAERVQMMAALLAHVS